MEQRVIYVDNNATTKVAPEVVEAMMPFLTERYGNPSSMHAFGGKVSKEVEMARENIAKLLQCNPQEIVFTSCGTESDNLGILGSLDALKGTKKHLITTAVEHPAVRNVMMHLSKRGYDITELKVGRDGMISLDDLKNSVTDQTALVSIMYANNETGVIFPIEEIGKIVKEKGAIFHVDAVQAVGKIPMNLSTSTIDLLSLSGHKIHAPKGIGALYIKKGTRVRPMTIGGHQERGRRAGTEAVPNIVALGAAAKLAFENMKQEYDEVKAKRDRLENWILNNVAHTSLNGHKEQRLPNTSSIAFDYIEGEAILLLFSKLGICASSGSACTSGSLEPSHVLRAMNVPFTSVHGSVRFSLSRYTSDEDIDYLIEHIPGIIKKLREISPFSEGSIIPNPTH